MEPKDYLKPDERLDELFDDHLIIQKSEAYRFTSDSVLLANYVKAGAKSKVVDLCSGSGIVGILVALKNSVKSMTLVELQPDLSDMSARTVAMNGLENTSSLNADARKVTEILGRESVDVICCNPPYYRVGEGKMSDVREIALSRHELEFTLKDLVKTSSDLLKFGGNLYVVYRADRLAELISELSEKKLETKDITFITPARGKEIDTVLLTAKKGGEKGVRIRDFLRSEAENDYDILKRK